MDLNEGTSYDEASDFNMWEIYRKELEVDGRTFNLLVQDTGEYNERHSKKKILISSFSLFTTNSIQEDKMSFIVKE